MKNKKQFVYRDESLYLHHTLTIDPYVDDFSFKSHSHNMVEIYFFLRGDARFVVEGNIYPLERGNLLVMTSGQTHNLLLKPCTAYERIALLVDTAVVPSEFEKLSEYVYAGDNLFELTKAEQVWFEESFALITKSQEDQQRGLIFCFLSMIFSLLSTKLAPNRSASVQDDLVKKAINYVNQNLTSDLNLDVIAGKLYCSKVSLNRKFNEIMGCTVWQYVIRRRVYNARQILFFSHSITDAFEKSGFADYSSFFRSYKKVVGVSQKEDLKKLKN